LILPDSNLPLDFAALEPNDSYHVGLGNNVWLMDSHRWALKIWEAEQKTGPYTLVHADYHWDGCYDIHNNPEKETELLAASAEQVAELVAEDVWIRNDSFIAPAVRRGLIQTVHFYCLQDDCGDKALDQDFLSLCGAKQFLHANVTSLASAEIDAPLIFDLCLDLFNRSDYWDTGDIWSDEDIIRFLDSAKNLIVRAELVTVSMSFGYSGTVQDTRNLSALVVPILLSYRSSFQ
jgi:hypothetical protein